MKDPAVLFYISDWITSTSEMDADCRGWYLNLILHNYDKKSLPDDMEKLAVLAGVKFSEFKRFEQVFKQVLEQKFKQIENNRLTNQKTFEILQSRKLFKEKRSASGKMSYLMRYFAKNYRKQYEDVDLKNFVRESINLDIDTKNEQVIEQVFKHLFELYRNENENININKDSIKEEEKIENLNLHNYILGGIEDWDNLTDEQKNKYSNLMYEELINSHSWITDFVRFKKISETKIKNELKDFCVNQKLSGDIKRGMKELKKHFTNIINKKIKELV